MGIMQKLTRIVNPNGDDDNYPDDIFGDGDEPGTERIYDNPDLGYPQVNMQTNTGYTTTPIKQQGNSGVSIGGSGSALELKVIRPERWENVNQIADHLINHRTVVLNLEATNKETARRMIDFLLGVVYTIEGDIKKVAANTWVITPNNVDMSQEQQAQKQQAANMNNNPYSV